MSSDYVDAHTTVFIYAIGTLSSLIGLFSTVQQSEYQSSCVRFRAHLEGYFPWVTGTLVQHLNGSALWLTEHLISAVLT